MPPVRLLLTVLILAAGAVGVWMLWGSRPSEEPTPLRSEAAEPDEDLRIPELRTTSLTIRVRTPDGKVPPGAEVGYLKGKRPFFLYAEHDGSRQFSAAPVGEVVIVAKAPGWEEARAVRHLSGGVVAEVTLILKPSGRGQDED